MLGDDVELNVLRKVIGLRWNFRAGRFVMPYRLLASASVVGGLRGDCNVTLSDEVQRKLVIVQYSKVGVEM